MKVLWKKTPMIGLTMTKALIGKNEFFNFRLIGLFIVGAAFFTTFPTSTKASNTPVNITYPKLQPVKTRSYFEIIKKQAVEKINPPVIYEDDPNSEIGTEIVLQKGTPGKISKEIVITFYQGEEVGREVVTQNVNPPQETIIAKGTKIIWRELSTAEGSLSYWRKLRVWATQYDSHCLGCNEWTATGMRAGKGVIAVDPNLIKLRTKVYIPGYGLAVAGDVGGGVKGKMIDLGFENTKTSGWSSRFVDIYLLN